MPAATVQRRRFSVPRALVLGLLAMTISLLAYASEALITANLKGWAWWAVPLAGSLVAGLGGALGSKAEVDRGPAGTRPGAPPARPRGLAVPVGVLLTVVLMAGLGVGAVAGARYLMEWLGAVGAGVPRLAEPRTVERDGLRLTVTGIEETRHYTRAAVTVRNRVGNRVDLVVGGGNCTLRDADGQVLEADPFKRGWTTTVPDGATQRGTIIFKGHLPADELSATLSFATVWEQGFEGPDSIAVGKLRLSAVER